MTKSTNHSLGSILLNSLQAAFGLFSFGFGVYLTIQANIGVGPWDAFTLGLSGTLGIKYGTASIVMSLIILAIDMSLREPIGIGMFLDAFIVGKTVDLFNWLNPVPLQNNIIVGLLLMLVGLVIMGFAQFIYMRAALGCGPRDTLLVALAKRMPKIPIGLISVAELAIVTFAGWRLGGPIGVGTLICAFLTGPIMQMAFRIARFEPTDVKHQNLMESIKVIFK